MSSHRILVAQSVYVSLKTGDVSTLRSNVHRHFRMHLTEGFPSEFKVDTEGPEALLLFWAKVTRFLSVLPTAEEIVSTEDGRIIVFGHYAGKTVEGGKPFSASFVHQLQFDGDRVFRLRQVTDTAAWQGALNPPQATVLQSEVAQTWIHSPGRRGLRVV